MEEKNKDMLARKILTLLAEAWCDQQGQELVSIEIEKKSAS